MLQLCGSSVKQGSGLKGFQARQFHLVGININLEEHHIRIRLAELCKVGTHHFAGPTPAAKQSYVKILHDVCRTRLLVSEPHHLAEKSTTTCAVKQASYESKHRYHTVHRSAWKLQKRAASQAKNGASDDVSSLTTVFLWEASCTKLSNCCCPLISTTREWGISLYQLHSARRGLRIQEPLKVL